MLFADERGLSMFFDFFDTSVPLNWKDVIGPTGVILTFVAGLWQYRRVSRRDFVKPLRETQLMLYESATSAAARLATLPRNGAPWREARDDFRRLYYGPMAMLEDFDHREGADALTVEQAMIVFKDCLDRQSDDDQLTDLALALAHTCRESLGRSWSVSFPEAAHLPELHGEYQQFAIKEWKKIDTRLAKSNRRMRAKRGLKK